MHLEMDLDPLHRKKQRESPFGVPGPSSNLDGLETLTQIYGGPINSTSRTELMLSFSVKSTRMEKS